MKTIWSLLKLRAKSALQPVFNDTKCAHGESKKDIKGLVLEFLILESLKYLNLVTEKLLLILDTLRWIIVLNYSSDDRNFFHLLVILTCSCIRVRVKLVGLIYLAIFHDQNQVTVFDGVQSMSYGDYCGALQFLSHYPPNCLFCVWIHVCSGFI